MPEKVIVIGAGPVGSLAALYAAIRGHDVEVYELRPDLRDPSTTPLNFTKSINLAISERGVNSLRQTGLPDLVDQVLSTTTPMFGRMIHLRKQGEYVRSAQQYSVHGNNLLAMDRTSLNTTLLNRIAGMPNVKIYFNHKLVGVDFNKKLAWLERHLPTDPPRGTELEVPFDFMIGADGAHSAVRYHLMKFVPMSYQQDYIDKLWCQFHVPASPEGEYRIPPNYLHIWPADDSMFIALPNADKSFTCTLFLSRAGFASLSSPPLRKGEKSPRSKAEALTSFFRANFPGVLPDLITEPELVDQFTTNPHLPLISIRCTPYHYTSSGVILGDAAHAMVPFYGQGLNAGLESVRVLFDFLDMYPDDRVKALEEYTKHRTPDAHTIVDLATGNYKEMATNVKKPLYLLRKRVEETLDYWVPGLGWKTLYERVTFGNERYAEVRRKERWQSRVLNAVLGVTGLGVIGAGLLFVRGGGLARVKMGLLRGVCWVARGLHGVGLIGGPAR